MRTILSFLLLLVFIAQCQPYESSTSKQAEGAIQDTLFRFTESTDVSVSMFENGNRFLSIKSPFAKSHQESASNYTTFSGNVKIELFDSLKAVVSQVTCATATFDTIQQTFEFIGKVRVVSQNERFLSTEKLTWFRNDRHIETDAYVEIFTPEDSLYGYGLISNEALDAYQIKRVTGNILIE